LAPIKFPKTPSQITHVDTLLKAGRRKKKGFKDFDSILEDFQLLFVIFFPFRVLRSAKKMKPIRRL